MAYGNTLRAYPGERLNKQRGWERRGLTYWTARLAHCQDRIRAADNSGALGRAIADREVAEVAVERLTQPRK